MEQQRLWIAAVVAIAMMVLPFSCLAAEHTVGGSAGWGFGANYTTWASANKFAVGDQLLFKYAVGAHDVLVVKEAAYTSCNTGNPLSTHSTGNDSITLATAGTNYYICGFGNGAHCSNGMKLAVTVSAASSPGPSSPVSGANPPAENGNGSNKSSAAPAPAENGNGSNKSAAAPSYRMGGVLLGGSVLLAMASL